MEIEILCSVSNDVAYHFEELNALIDSISIEEVKIKIGE
jgi:hypothetical protein